MFIREIILNKLRDVINPEDKRDIVTSGLVKAINVSDELNVSDQFLEVVIRYKSQNRQVARLLRSSILNSLAEYSNNFMIRVKFDKISPINEKIYGSKTQLPKLSMQKLAVCSPRGGIGQTAFCINLGVALTNLDFKVGVLDMDLYGPDLSLILGLEEEPFYINKKAFVFEKFGVCLMSLKKLMQENSNFNYRGSCVERCVQQILQEIELENLNLMLFNLPPGSGDTQIALAQFIGFNGVILISSAQDPIKTELDKMIHFFQDINIPILGILEDSSYMSSKVNTIPTFLDLNDPNNRYGVKYLGQLPIELISREILSTPMQATINSGNIITNNSFNQIAGIIKGNLYH